MSALASSRASLSNFSANRAKISEVNSFDAGFESAARPAAFTIAALSASETFSHSIDPLVMTCSINSSEMPFSVKIEECSFMKSLIFASLFSFRANIANISLVRTSGGVFGSIFSASSSSIKAFSSFETSSHSTLPSFLTLSTRSLEIPLSIKISACPLRTSIICVFLAILADSLASMSAVSVSGGVSESNASGNSFLIKACSSSETPSQATSPSSATLSTTSSEIPLSINFSLLLLTIFTAIARIAASCFAFR